MEWEFINSVTIQLAKIVFQNFLYSKKGLPEQNLLLGCDFFSSQTDTQIRK